MKIKAYPRHEIKFSLRDFLSFFIARKKDICHQFEKEFLSLTNARYALLLPSCRVGVFHIIDSLRTDYYAISGTTFSAMKICIDHFATDGKIQLIENQYNVKISSPQQTTLLTHLFHTENFNVIDSNGSFIIEDCAHCFIPAFLNEKFKLTGDAAVFSFGVGKSLNTLGGGILITNDFELFKNLKSKMNEMDGSKVSILLMAFKTFIMSYITRGLIFSIITFPVIKLISYWKADFLDQALNESVTRENLLEQIYSAKRFTNLQAHLGLSQIKEFNEILVKRSKVIIALKKNINNIYHSFLDKNFTYLMVPFKNRDNVRKELLALNIDTKLSDMNCYFDSNHPDFIKNESYLEIPFSIDWNIDEIKYLSICLNKISHNVIA